MTDEISQCKGDKASCPPPPESQPASHGHCYSPGRKQENQNVAAQPKSAGRPGRSPAQEQVTHLLGAEGKHNASYKRKLESPNKQKVDCEFFDSKN